MTRPRLAVAIETSGVPGSAAAATAEGTVEVPIEAAAEHGRGLLRALDTCVRRLGAAPGDVDCVIVGVGPGSYTGLRVGVAAAKAIAFARGCRLVAVPSTEAVALLAPDFPGPIAVAVDAKRGEIFAAVYARGPEGLREIRPPELLRPEQLVERAGPDALVLGEGAIVHAATFAAGGLRVGDPALARPRAGALLRVGLRALDRVGASDPSAVEPLYLRVSAAEERRASSPPR